MKLKLRLYGRVKFGRDNAETFMNVVEDIRFYFSKSDLSIVDMEVLTDNRNKYPSFYCAGYYTDGEKELVLVEHAESMKSAYQGLDCSFKNIAKKKDVSNV